MYSKIKDLKFALGLALGAALLLGLPQFGLAQRPGDDRRPPNAQDSGKGGQPGKNDRQAPGAQDSGKKGQPGKNDRQAPSAHDSGKGGQPGKNEKRPAEPRDGRGEKSRDFNKWDKGWNGPEARSQHGRNNKGGGEFKRFNPGVDHSRLREMARSGKMTGYKPLPDSVRKSIHLGRPLPRKADPRPVPEHMRKRLPAHPGYEWRITGRDLVLVAVGSMIVYEIFTNVFD